VPLTLRPVAGPLLLGLLAVAAAHCSGGEDRPTSAAAEAILGGGPPDAPDAPVLYLQGPEGSCTAVLVAANLVITARHCVAQNTPGPFACTASGDLIPNSNGTGQIGADDPPGSLSFFLSTRTLPPITQAPDAVGMQTISTKAPTACRDDVALVILDRPVPGLAPAPIRISQPTQVGELVTVWGYGLTDQRAPTMLRSRPDVSILGVGPDTPSTITQPAPVRSLRTGPVTCQGDSGGPLLSQATGAVVGVVSLGSQAGGPFCDSSNLSDTIGPRLGAYHDFILSAFKAAGATPLEEESGQDAAPPEDSVAALDSTIVEDAPSADTVAADQEIPMEGARPLGPMVFRATGGSCTTAPGRRGGRGAIGTLALAWTALAVGRRRR
jgi:V8-like Glu-specific endopeptidase